jgi:hypothetical protein
MQSREINRNRVKSSYRAIDARWRARFSILRPDVIRMDHAAISPRQRDLEAASRHFRLTDAVNHSSQFGPQISFAKRGNDPNCAKR